MTNSQCKSCGAPIVWITTPAGKSMPLDATAETWWQVNPAGSQQGSPSAHPIQVRRSHFATCKFADQHRKVGVH